MDDLFGHPVDVLRNAKIVDAALGLRAVIGVHGYFHLAHGILLDPVLHTKEFCGAKVVRKVLN